MMNLTQKTKSAFLICFVEAWERFSYYGMRALLVLFLTSQLGFQDVKAYSVYSLFAAIGYAVPVLAGFLADRVLGFQRTLILGGFVLCFGHAALAFTCENQSTVYLGLALITVGTGFFKGNVTNLLGTIYDAQDPERNKAFTWFYVSVNIGGAIAAIVCGVVAKSFGWHYGFGIAGFGMLISTLVFLKFRYLLGDNGLKPNVIEKKEISFGIQKSILIAFLVCMASFFMLSNAELTTKYFSQTGLIMLVIVLFVFFRHTPEERKDMAVLFVLTFFTMLFFAVEMQLGSFINLFTERNVDKAIFGWEVPAASLQSINPIAIIFLGSIFAGVFAKLGNAWNIKRFALGLLVNALCFVVIYSGCLASNNGEVKIIYLIVGMLFMGFAEIAMAPVIQSLITVMSPAGIRGFMMGLLMFALSYSNMIGLVVSKFMAVPKEEVANKMVSLGIYQNGFLNITVVSFLVLAVFTIFIPWLNKRVLKVTTNT